MIFTIGGNSYPFANPEYSYEVTINLGIQQILTSDNVVRWFDHDISVDHRVSSINFKINATDAAVLNDLLRQASEGRNTDCLITLNSSEDLFLFGPDLGNSGTFNCTIINYSVPFQLTSPFRYYDFSMELKLNSNPAYSLPPQVREGDLQIGSTNYLMNDRFELTTTRNYGNSISNNGDVYRVDKLESNDYQILDINLPI